MVIKRLIVAAIIIILSLVTLRPLFSDGFFPMHDDAQVARVVVMGRALQHGQFPVRMVEGLGYGYGYPLYNFYAPLPYYIGGGLYALGLSGIDATKLMIGIGMGIGGIGIYLLSSSLFGLYGGIFSLMLYMLFPYRAVQIYVRGAIGEFWASAWIPYMLYGIVLIVQKKYKQGILIGGVGFFGIILSHTVFGYISIGSMALVLALCLLGYLVHRVEKQKLLSLILLLGIGLSFSAFFWLPALVEMQYTNVLSAVGSTADYHDHFVCLGQLWDSPWGFGGSAKGCIDGMSFKIGKVHILFALLGLGALVYYRKRRTIAWYVGLGAGIGIVCSVVAMLSYSSVLWDFIPYSNFIQYPWRFLTLAGISIALLGSFFFAFLKQSVSLGIVGLGTILLFLTNLKLFTPQYLYQKDKASYETREELSYRASKASDEYLPMGIPKPESPDAIVNARLTSKPGLTVTQVMETETKSIYRITSDRDQEVVLSMAYFPGWEVFIDGKVVIPQVVDGMPSVLLSKGQRDLRIQFSNTPIRNVANLISIMTLPIIVLIAVWKKNPQ